MDCERIAYALREIADALTHPNAPKTAVQPATSPPKIHRPRSVADGGPVDDVTRARAKRILRSKGYVEVK